MHDPRFAGWAAPPLQFQAAVARWRKAQSKTWRDLPNWHPLRHDHCRPLYSPHLAERVALAFEITKQNFTYVPDPLGLDICSPPS